MPKSAERVMKILELCRTSKRGFRNVELSDILDIPASSLSILLSSMEKNGFLTLHADDKRYVLGPQILVLASHFLSNLDLVEIGYPILKRVVADTDEAASISIKKDNESICICKVDSPQPLTRAIVVGSCAPLYASAAGKVFLAHASKEERQKYFSCEKLMPLTSKTITSHEKLLHELYHIKQTGYAQNREELNENIVAFAAPVFDIHGAVNASVNLAIPSFRCNAKKQKQLVSCLKNAAEAISSQLGYTKR